MTRWGENLDPKKVWQEYPRPQFQRSDWLNLNGLWEYAILPKSTPAPKKYQGYILVPFCVESALSGVGKDFTPQDRLWYKTTFDLSESWSSRRIMLNFEAVDWSATVWINGAVVGSHKGAYDRFSFDISPYLKAKGKQEIVVAVDDASSMGEQARGKQQLNQHGIWYTPVSGIWQTVWLEAVPSEASLKEVRITTDIDLGQVTLAPMLNAANPDNFSVKATVLMEGTEIASETFPVETEQSLPILEPRLWSPDDPFLYTLKLVLYDNQGLAIDEIDSYFGMRKISLGEVKGTRALFLNNKPLFHYGTLDQGWWPDGLHTPPSDEAMAYDLEVTKSMGFNMIRKHIKVEPDRWYYHCDRLGIMVGEYGGIGLPIKGHLWNPEMRNWGYQTYKTTEELIEHYKHKFDQIVEMKRSMGLSAAIYTQTTDVEGEVNGLMTYDRKVIKIPVEKLYEIHTILYEE